MNDISVSIIVKNAESTFEDVLKSVYGWTREIIVVDSFSTDKTIEIAKKYDAMIFEHKYDGEGQQRNYALKKANTEWILALDADEVVTPNLKKEITQTISNSKFSGYKILLRGHLKGKKLNYGGENYYKMNLFRRKIGYSTNDELHAVYKVKDNNIGYLKNKIDHFSYLSITHIFIKFTKYSLIEAKKKKIKGEKSSLKKIFLYPPHMFWARFIKDKGYKDGFFRVPLDLGFAYMEFLTYVLMLFPLKTKKL